MAHPASRQTGAHSRTSNEDYGAYETDWGRINISQLPSAVKNKHLDRHQRTFRTASEEYGNFWSTHGRALPIPSHGARRGGSRFTPQATPTTYLPETPSVAGYGGRDLEMEVKQRPAPRDSDNNKPGSLAGISRDNDIISGIMAHTGSSLPPINQTRTSGSGAGSKGSGSRKVRQTLLSQQRIASRESQAKQTRTHPVGSHPTTKARKVNTNSNTSTAGLRLKGTGGKDIKLPELDLQRIDLDLHTADGRVVTISAVPVYISSFKK